VDEGDSFINAQIVLCK